MVNLSVSEVVRVNSGYTFSKLLIWVLRVLLREIWVICVSKGKFDGYVGRFGKFTFYEF